MLRCKSRALRRSKLGLSFGESPLAIVVAHDEAGGLFFDKPGRREAAALDQVVAGRLRRTRNTTKCDIEKFTMKLAMTASSFASHTGKSRTSTATRSAAVLANHPMMPDATKVK